MRKGLSTLLAILSLGTFSPSQAQEQPSAGVIQILLDEEGAASRRAKATLNDKKVIDFIVESNIFPAIYAGNTNLDAVSVSIYKAQIGFNFIQSDANKKQEYNSNMNFNVEKYKSHKIIEMHPYKFTLPGFSVDVTCVYSDPDVLNKNGILTLEGTVNSEPFNMKFFYINGRLAEAKGSLGSKTITAAYEPAKKQGLERLVESGTVTIDNDRYKLEFGIDVDATSSYNGFSVSRLK